MHGDLLKVQARRNISLSFAASVFQKRAYLPISAIYFVQVSGLSLLDLGQVVALYAFVLLLSDLPTGYLADRIGRVGCLRIGAGLNLIAVTMFALLQHKTGVLIGTTFEALGYGFLMGSSGALVHDSLEVLGDTKSFSKVQSRRMSVSLIINAVLLALTPLSYAIDVRLPFVIGALMFVGLFVSTLKMKDLPHARTEKISRASIGRMLTRKRVMLFLFAVGLTSALHTGLGDITRVAVVDFGLNPANIGWFLAASSLLGAAIGFWVHHLKRLPLQYYVLFDSLMASMVLFSAWFGSAYVLGVAILINLAFWRYRRAIYQHHMVELLPTRYKGTLFSGISMLEEVNLMWVPIVASLMAHNFGYQYGLAVCGAAAAIWAVVMYAIAVVFLNEPRVLASRRRLGLLSPT